MSDGISTGKVSRDAIIRGLDIGDTVAIAHRMDTSFGVDGAAVAATGREQRGTLDQSAHRARKATGQDYTVENGTFVTRDGAIMIVAVATRTK